MAEEKTKSKGKTRGEKETPPAEARKVTGGRGRDKAPSPDSIPKPTAELSRYVAFTYAEVDRSKVKNAPYNPRTIDRDARAGLLKELKSHGLVEPIVWNLRTGNLVGGHQRLSILDDLHGGADYRVPASVIDVGEQEEKRKNVALNSPDLQGRYDGELFNALLVDMKAVDPTFDVGSLGLSEITLEATIGVDSALYLPPETDITVEAVLDESEKIKKMKSLKRQHRQNQREAEVKEAARFLAIEIPAHLPLETIDRRRDAMLNALGMPVGRRDPVVPAWRIEKAFGIEVPPEESCEADGEGEASLPPASVPAGTGRTAG